MKILLATDHAGFEMKEYLKTWLVTHGYEIEDCGTNELDPNDDYPKYMKFAALGLANDPSIRAIVFGGSGTGEGIVMNRYPHVRAVVYNGQHNEVVKLGREHNDTNALSIGARFISTEQLIDAVQIFLNTEFEGGKHARRVDEIDPQVVAPDKPKSITYGAETPSS